MLIYIDTNIWIYAYENNANFGELARQVLGQARSKQHQLAGSLYVLGELLVAPTYQQREFTLAAYRRLFASTQVELLPYTSRALETYVQLRALRRLKPMDALHLATAADAGVNIFVTEDTRLLSESVRGISRIVNLETAQGLL